MKRPKRDYHKLVRRGEKYWYSGTMNIPTMESEAKRAYSSWRNQRDRCYNPTNRSYRHYGDKGITVGYCSRAFIGWWLVKMESFLGDDPTVGRIDHNKGYFFENIKIESRGDNTREQMSRHGNPGELRAKPVVAIRKSNNRIIGVYKSQRDAAKHTGVSQAQIQRMLTGQSVGPRISIYFKLKERAKGWISANLKT